MERSASPLITVIIMTEDKDTKRVARRYHHLSPLENQAIFGAHARGVKVLDLAAQYNVSRQTIYNVIHVASKKEAFTTATHEGCQSGVPSQKQKRSRRILPEIRAGIAEIKRKYPSWGVVYIREHWIKAGHAPVSVASIYRILREAGLQTRAQVEKEVYQRFEMTRPGQLWQMDIEGQIHLPGIGWVYGFSILDDFSRFCPGFRYFTDAKLSNGILLLNEAINKHGVPDKMYTDNGSQFASKGERLNNFELYCAANAIGITHTEPGRPQGKGKIERFYETVENQFITWVRVKIKEMPSGSSYTIEHLNRDLAAYLQDDYHARVHGGTNETPASRFFKEPLRRPDPPVDVAKFLERVTTRQVNKFGEVSFNGYKIQVGLPGRSHVKVVETIETVRIEQGESLVREIDKKALSKEPPIKRQAISSISPPRVSPSLPAASVDTRANHVRSRSHKSSIARKTRAYDPDENGIYYRNVLQDGRFKWKDHKYLLGSMHANEKISIRVSGDELIIRDTGETIIKSLKVWHPGRKGQIHEQSINEKNVDPEISVATRDVEGSNASMPEVEQSSDCITDKYGPDKDGLYTRRVETTGKFWWRSARYYLSKKFSGRSVRLRVVDNALHVLDEGLVPLKILKIRDKSPK